MARFGTWSPLSPNWNKQPVMKKADIISFHTMVGSLAGTDAMFRRNGFGGTFSHFGFGARGEVTQWQDTAYRAAANLDGNYHIISGEFADYGDGFPKWNTSDGKAVPAFTDEQVEAAINWLVTMCKAHEIPCAAIPDSKVGRRGVGWHRLGVPGYMVPGTEKWSSAQGKVCPGDRRIAQIKNIIIPSAQQILTTPIQTAAAKREAFLMALSDAEQAELLTRVRMTSDQLGGPNWAAVGDANKSWGWPTIRFGDKQESLTMVDFLRQIDRQLNSGIGLDNRPAGDVDNELGHLISLRAEVRALASKLDQVIADRG